LATKGPKKNRFKNSVPKRRRRRAGRLKGMLRITGIFAGLVLLSGLFVFSHDFITQCHYFNAQEIEVTGNRVLSRATVLDHLKVYEGVNILSVNLRTLRRHLLAHPWVREADISREIPSSIRIHVREQQPLAMVDLGKRFLVNRDGMLFKKFEGQYKGHLPLISGLSITDFNDEGHRETGQAFAAVLKVLALGGGSESPLPNQRIARIRVDREIGLTIDIAGISGRQRRVHLGYRDYEKKYGHLTRVLAYIAGKPALAGVRTFDLKNLNFVVVNPRETGDTGREKEV